jgi:hypothetical protein
MTHIEITAPQFYIPNEVHAAEARRLELMAALADRSSMAALSDVMSVPGAVCIDVGAGDSTSLGRGIVEANPSAHYLPVDMREDAVMRHTAAGFAARMGSATELPFDDGAANATHARFTYAWLGEEGRGQALDEMLRVGTANSRTVLIDYDWTVTDGPAPYRDLVNHLTDLMRGFGFDPNYGAKSTVETTRNMALRGYTPSNSTITEARQPISSEIAASIPTIEATVLPIIEKLRSAGATEQATYIEELLGAVYTHAELHPDEAVRLPDIVSVIVDRNQQTSRGHEVVSLKQARVVAEVVTSSEVAQAIGPESLAAYRLPQSKIIEARRIHAEAYKSHRYVTPDGINSQDGTLVEALDPQELIARSVYIGSINDEGRVDGTIRLLEPENGDIMSLPTMQKLVETLGIDHPAIQELPFIDGASRVFEGSALGRSSECKDPFILAKLLISVIVEARARDYDYAIVGLVSGTSRLLTTVYGEEMFHRIDGHEAEFIMKGEGLNPQGVTLVPFYVDVRKFLEQGMERFDGVDSDQARQIYELFREASEFSQSADVAVA